MFRYTQPSSLSLSFCQGEGENPMLWLNDDPSEKDGQMTSVDSLSSGTEVFHVTRLGAYGYNGWLVSIRLQKAID